MDCGVTRDWLLQADRPGDAAARPAAVAGHLQSCPDCAALAGRLARIEGSLRDEPLPASVLDGRDAFLRRLAATPAPARPSRNRSSRWAVAALMLLAFGLASMLVLPGSPARASSDVVDRLIDWNVALADDGGRADAATRFAAAEPGLTADLGRLGAGERELAETLLDNGRWLAAHDDPVEAASRMHDVADRLLEKVRRAAARGDAKQSQQFVRQFRRVTERALGTNLDRAAALATLTPEQQKRIERLERKAAERQQALAELKEKMPNASKKELLKALELSRKKPKAKQPARKGES